MTSKLGDQMADNAPFSENSFVNLGKVPFECKLNSLLLQIVGSEEICVCSC